MPRTKGIYMIFRTKEELELHDRMVRIITQQQTMDAVTLALREEFKFTPPKYKRLDEAVSRKWDEICSLCNEDVRNDKAFEYAKAVIDRALLEAVGEEQFKPYDQRYCL